MSISSKLREYIRENNISKEDIANLTGIDPIDLELSLNEKRTFSFDEFEKILVIIGEKADRFFATRR
ncbi:hypothetical protein [Metaclostridioides mangenotii]|uniref:hypothetical protein n=1 Tax=Metaclostridioides mangenotii TaxID=1540 RepID=UPI0028E93362|nr:hypothetical protein [Clostridioides mangenotii]